VLKKLPDDLIQIDGHADPRGASDFNLDLSKRRADAVASTLVAQGIDRARIVILAKTMYVNAWNTLCRHADA
jgi:outer membrane protein OmpA-like peptidoglycan-associated protein